MGEENGENEGITKGDGRTGLEGKKKEEEIIEKKEGGIDTTGGKNQKINNVGDMI